jgi:hypothetical protein
MHANTDEDGFVKKMTYTPGNVHDSKEFDKLLGINKHEHKNKINIDLYCENGFLRAISNQCEMYQNSISNKAYQQYYRMSTKDYQLVFVVLLSTQH